MSHTTFISSHSDPYWLVFQIRVLVDHLAVRSKLVDEKESHNFDTTVHHAWMQLGKARSFLSKDVYAKLSGPERSFLLS